MACEQLAQGSATLERNQLEHPAVVQVCQQEVLRDVHDGHGLAKPRPGRNVALDVTDGQTSLAADHDRPVARSAGWTGRTVSATFRCRNNANEVGSPDPFAALALRLLNQS